MLAGSGLVPRCRCNWKVMQRLRSPEGGGATFRAGECLGAALFVARLGGFFFIDVNLPCADHVKVPFGETLLPSTGTLDERRHAGRWARLGEERVHLGGVLAHEQLLLDHACGSDVRAVASGAASLRTAAWCAIATNRQGSHGTGARFGLGRPATSSNVEEASKRWMKGKKTKDGWKGRRKREETTQKSANAANALVEVEGCKEWGLPFSRIHLLTPPVAPMEPPVFLTLRSSHDHSPYTDPFGLRSRQVQQRQQTAVGRGRRKDGATQEEGEKGGSGGGRRKRTLGSDGC